MKKLTVLGSGDAFGSGGKYNTSFLIEGSEKNILLDCGASTLIRMQQLKKDISQISTVFITHFHGDHFGGLPFLILYWKYQSSPKFPVSIIGPEGIKEKVIQLQDALYPKTSSLIDALNIRFIEFSEDWQSVSGLEYRAFPVKHSSPSNPHGLKLKWNNKTLSFSGDTEWTENLLKLSENSDLFICECNKYDKPISGHLNYLILSEKFNKYPSDKIYLTHMGNEMLDQGNIEFKRLEDSQELELW